MNQQPVSETSKDGNSQKTSGQTVVVEGLDSGTVIGIAFAAFIIGVLLVAALWFIHTHTGQASLIIELYMSHVICVSICNLQCLNELIRILYTGKYSFLFYFHPFRPRPRANLRLTEFQCPISSLLNQTQQSLGEIMMGRNRLQLKKGENNTVRK